MGKKKKLPRLFEIEVIDTRQRSRTIWSGKKTAPYPKAALRKVVKDLPNIDFTEYKDPLKKKGSRYVFIHSEIKPVL